MNGSIFLLITRLDKDNVDNDTEEKKPQ